MLANAEAGMNTTHNAHDCVWLVSCAILVFLMQAGFCCLETGLVRAKNSINVAVKNLVDFLVASLTFWAIGFCLMFGASRAGLFGTTGSLFEPRDPWLASFFLFQLTFCGTATTIVSGAVAERVRFSSYMMLSLLVSGVIYPVFGHWAWGRAAGAPTNGWLGALGFVDFAGSSVVHSLAGWVSLAAVLRVGPRRGRFCASGQRPIQGHSIPLAILGLFILWFGWFGFNAGSTLAVSERIASICINTNLAAAAGGLTGAGLGYAFTRRPDVVAMTNGTLAGLVGITASCHVMTPAAAMTIGCVASALYFASNRLLERFEVDDAVGAVPVHLAAGVWGTLAVALLGNPQEFGTGFSRWQQLGVQALGAASCAAWAFGAGWLAVCAVDRLWGLRVGAHAERIGLNQSEHGISTELVELLSEMDQHRLTGDISRPVAVEPHTEVGQIARQYNNVLDQIRRGIERQRVTTRALEASEARNRAIVENAGEGIIIFDAGGRIEAFNAAAARMFGHASAEVVGSDVSMLIPALRAAGNGPSIWQCLSAVQTGSTGNTREVEGQRKDGTAFPLKLVISEFQEGGQRVFMGIISDLTEEKKLQCGLAQAQKLEAVGQLAAGIAHEINTPLQFLGDNTRFLKDSFNEVIAQLEDCRRALAASDAGEASGQQPRDAANSSGGAEIDYLAAEIPQCLEQMEEGIGRVVTIVRAMKAFSHPGTADFVQTDLNKCLGTTLVVSRNEWKYVANVETDLDPELPLILGVPGELNQVFLNLIVNAAQAIAGAVPEGQKGTIRVVTRRAGSEVEVRISDTGPGIPESIRRRVFEPFFTTKEVGMGTGQGLAIARAVVVDRHGGTIDFESQPGRGTTFTIRHPISGNTHDEAPCGSATHSCRSTEGRPA